MEKSYSFLVSRRKVAKSEHSIYHVGKGHHSLPGDAFQYLVRYFVISWCFESFDLLDIFSHSFRGRMADSWEVYSCYAPSIPVHLFFMVVIIVVVLVEPALLFQRWFPLCQQHSPEILETLVLRVQLG